MWKNSRTNINAHLQKLFTNSKSLSPIQISGFLPANTFPTAFLLASIADTRDTCPKLFSRNCHTNIQQSLQCIHSVYVCTYSCTLTGRLCWQKTLVALNLGQQTTLWKLTQCIGILVLSLQASIPLRYNTTGHSGDTKDKKNQKTSHTRVTWSVAQCETI